MENLTSGQAQPIGKHLSVIAQTFSLVPALSKLSHETRANLGRKMQCRLLMKGAVLQLSHSGEQNIFFIAMGEAKTDQITPDGLLKTESLGVGDVFADCKSEAVVDKSSTFVATTNCLVCYLLADDYISIVALNRNPAAIAIHGFADALDELGEWVNGSLAPSHRLHI